MGIQGLIPFVKNATRESNIRNFSGYSAAIDAYCWLHKGAFSCADRLVRGEKTDGYVNYCIKMVNMLKSCNVNPIMVFDGCNLPSKAVTEKKRRENRERNVQLAKQFLQQGLQKQAREHFQRAINITSEMANETIATCRKLGVDCIVGPYEADSQIAFLCKSGIAQIAITEDSDLILFGCARVFLKMDASGRGLLVEKSRLHLAMGLNAENFTFQKFRHMCILSGCDYLPSLPGIGLKKACKFFSKTSNPDVESVLQKLPSYLKMPQLTVTEEYIENFIKADNTFLYQLVFCPLQRKIVPLNPYPPGQNQSDFNYAGPHISDEKGLHIALGNINVDNMKNNGNFSLKFIDKKMSKIVSMWDPSYKIRKFSPTKKQIEERSSTKGVEILLPSNLRFPQPMKKRRIIEDINVNIEDYEENVTNMYKEKTDFSTPSKRCKLTNNVSEAKTDDDDDEGVLIIKESPLKEIGECKKSKTESDKYEPNASGCSPQSEPEVRSRFFQTAPATTSPTVASTSPPMRENKLENSVKEVSPKDDVNDSAKKAMCKINGLPSGKLKFDAAVKLFLNTSNVQETCSGKNDLNPVDCNGTHTVLPNNNLKSPRCGNFSWKDIKDNFSFNDSSNTQQVRNPFKIPIAKPSKSDEQSATATKDEAKSDVVTPKLVPSGSQDPDDIPLSTNRHNDSTENCDISILDTVLTPVPTVHSKPKVLVRKSCSSVQKGKSQCPRVGLKKNVSLTSKGNDKMKQLGIIQSLAMFKYSKI